MRTTLPAFVFVMMSVSCVLSSIEAGTDEDVRWSGWVLSDIPSAEGNEVLETGTLVITHPDGSHLTDGIPAESSPGFFGMDVQPDTEIGIRITAQTTHPTVWRTRTPRANGFWLYGALYGVDTQTLALTLDQVAELSGEEIPWADDGLGALIYGAPFVRGELDQEAWTGAELTALDSTGHQGTVVQIAQDPESGLTGLAAGHTGVLGPNDVDGPTVMFIAYDLAPGPIRLIVTGSDGRSAVADWVAQDGDVLSAFHLTLPEND